MGETDKGEQYMLGWMLAGLALGAAAAGPPGVRRAPWRLRMASWLLSAGALALFLWLAFGALIPPGGPPALALIISYWGAFIASQWVLEPRLRRWVDKQWVADDSGGADSK